MQTTIANLKNMNSEERRKWEKKNNFTSYKTVLEDIFSKIAKLNENSLQDEIEFYNIIENNSDVIEIKNDAIVEKIENETYQLISNRSGIFQNSTLINKVEHNLHNIYSIEHYKKNSNFEELLPVKSNEIKPNISNRNSRPTFLTDTYTNDNPGCKSDRRLIAKVQYFYQNASWAVRKTCASGYSYDVIYNIDAPQLLHSVKAERKRFCTWSTVDRFYETDIQIIDHEYTVYTFNNNENMKFGVALSRVKQPDIGLNYSTGPSTFALTDVYGPTGNYNDAVLLRGEMNLRDAIVNEPSVGSNFTQNYTGFEKVQFKASSTGIGNNFVEISL